MSYKNIIIKLSAILLVFIFNSCSKVQINLKPEIINEERLKRGPDCPKKTNTGIVFKFKNMDAEKVYLVGSFNNWNVNDRALMHKNETGVWSITKRLKPGFHKYKFYANKRLWPDSDNPIRALDGTAASIIEITKNGNIRFRAIHFTKKNPGKYYKNFTAVKSPEWLNKAVIYEIYFRIFTKKGTIKAAIEKLSYLKKFGVNIICLLPVQEQGIKKKKGILGSPYSIKDFRKINPVLGTEEDFQDFIKEAHKQGFKVIMDWAAGYTSWDNSLINKHPGWYVKKYGKIISPSSKLSDVAALNYKSRALHKYMKESMVHWVTKYKLDGFRCITTDKLTPLSFWKSIRDVYTTTKPDFLLISVSENPVMHTSIFNITYEYRHRHFFKNVFANEDKAYNFKIFYNNLKYSFPKNALRLRCMENYNSLRAIKFLSKKMILPASAILFAIDGIPFISAGQEFGDLNWKNQQDLFDKVTLNWGDFDDDLFNHYKKLIALRRKYSVFINGDIFFLENTNAYRVFTFLRVKGKERILIAANLSPYDSDINIIENSLVGLGADGKYKFTDLFTDEEKLKKELVNLRIKLKPYEFIFYKLEEVE